MAAEGSKGLARLFCSSAGGGEGRLNLGEKGTVEWYRGHPPTTTATRKRPHVFGGMDMGLQAWVKKTAGNLPGFFGAMLRNRADGREASENENGGRRRMVTAGLSTMDGRHGGTYPSWPLSLSPGQRQGGLGSVSVASNPGTFRGLSFVRSVSTTTTGPHRPRHGNGQCQKKEDRKEDKNKTDLGLSLRRLGRWEWQLGKMYGRDLPCCRPSSIVLLPTVQLACCEARRVGRPRRSCPFAKRPRCAAPILAQSPLSCLFQTLRWMEIATTACLAVDGSAAGEE